MKVVGVLQTPVMILHVCPMMDEWTAWSTLVDYCFQAMLLRMVVLRRFARFAVLARTAKH